MSRNGKGESIGLRCAECNTFVYIMERSHTMKVDGKKVSGSKKYCKKCRKRVDLKEFSKFHYSDKQAKKKSKRNVAKAEAAAAAQA